MSGDVEVLKAAIALAVADGKLRGAELGVIQGLANRAGVEPAVFEAMLESARTDVTFTHRIRIPPAKARSAVLLLVAEARIDGRISPEERRVIVRVAHTVGLHGRAFREVYEEGIKQADDLRRPGRE